MGDKNKRKRDSKGKKGDAKKGGGVDRTLAPARATNTSASGGGGSGGYGASWSEAR